MLHRSHLVAFIVIAGCKASAISPAGVDAGASSCARLGFPSLPSPTTGKMPSSVAVADVSRDGKPDIMVANRRDNTVSVLVGNGDGTFQAKVDYPTGSEPVSVALADVTGAGSQTSWWPTRATAR